jgi:hypothetical protein
MAASSEEGWWWWIVHCTCERSIYYIYSIFQHRFHNYYCKIVQQVLECPCLFAAASKIL